jgi:hypothetical protein
MPRTGRPPKPVERKRALGNPGKRALPAATTLAVLPAVQTGALDLEPDEAFARLVDEGASWIAETDAVVAGMVREALVERKQLRERALAGSAEARKELRELEKQLTTWLSSLGFDPAARSRLGLAEVKARSTLEQLREKRSAKVAD